jgi:hypothetical protein
MAKHPTSSDIVDLYTCIEHKVLSYFVINLIKWITNITMPEVNLRIYEVNDVIPYFWISWL